MVLLNLTWCDAFKVHYCKKYSRTRFSFCIAYIEISQMQFVKAVEDTTIIIEILYVTDLLIYPQPGTLPMLSEI